MKRRSSPPPCIHVVPGDIPSAEAPLGERRSTRRRPRRVRGGARCILWTSSSLKRARANRDHAGAQWADGRLAHGVPLVLRRGFGRPHPQARALHIPLRSALPGLNAELHGYPISRMPITFDLRQEPGAGKPHAGICAGGGWQQPSLPRPLVRAGVAARRCASWANKVSLARLDCLRGANEAELGFSPIAFAQASAPREKEETRPPLPP